MNCLHCGNKDLEVVDNPEKKRSFFMLCLDCGARGPEKDNKTQAKAAWMSQGEYNPPNVLPELDAFYEQMQRDAKIYNDHKAKMKIPDTWNDYAYTTGNLDLIVHYKQLFAQCLETIRKEYGK